MGFRNLILTLEFLFKKVVLEQNLIYLTLGFILKINQSSDLFERVLLYV